ncbi:SDR family NAD(P)-dependent oxidoreductase [Allomesorhizobium camelthorni]|uniref:SDR family NAD(P)-dependent oxidoreductase n=1 Tax=Allomesorhizobium camelthorni TaxID=475069 RepID=UPI001980FEE7
MQRHVSFVTGAASGIGLAIAQQLSRRGDAVAIADLNVKAGEAAAQALRDSGHEAIFVELDVAKRESWVKAVNLRGTWALKRFSQP